MRGAWTSIPWQGRTARAWVPDPLVGDELALGVRASRKTERAAAAVVRADERLPGSWEPVARILLRSEGVASSNIEGLRAPIESVAVAEIDPSGVDSTAAWVADNLIVVRDAVRSARKRLSVTGLHRWHRQLMRHGDLPGPMVGSFRREPGWIGASSPLDAVFVPPPPAKISPLMADLVRFANGRDVDPITQAAVLHAQFETIHPYGDGNGRLGRVLISWVLARQLDVALPPPVSVLIARDPGGYLAGLYQFREGSLDSYVDWFADVVIRAGAASIALGERIRGLLDDYHSRVDALRADASARRLVDLLPEHPVINSRIAAARLDTSERSARSALDTLEERGIVTVTDVPTAKTGRPPRWWVARELLDLVGTWAR